MRPSRWPRPTPNWRPWRRTASWSVWADSRARDRCRPCARISTTWTGRSRRSRSNAAIWPPSDRASWTWPGSASPAHSPCWPRRTSPPGPGNGSVSPPTRSSHLPLTADTDAERARSTGRQLLGFLLQVPGYRAHVARIGLHRSRDRPGRRPGGRHPGALGRARRPRRGGPPALGRRRRSGRDQPARRFRRARRRTGRPAGPLAEQAMGTFGVSFPEPVEGPARSGLLGMHGSMIRLALRQAQGT